MDEEMLSEDGKYYNVIKAVMDDRSLNISSGSYDSIDEKTRFLYDTYGEKLIEKKHPVLKEYLQKQEENYQGLFCRMSKQTGGNVINRMSQLRSEIEDIENVLELI